MTILPSEGPSALGLSTCDTFASTSLSTRSPMRNSNVDVMKRGSTDEAVRLAWMQEVEQCRSNCRVIVKFGADEFMVTWMRAKHQISDRALEVKGGTCKRLLSVD